MHAWTNRKAVRGVAVLREALTVRRLATAGLLQTLHKHKPQESFTQRMQPSHRHTSSHAHILCPLVHP